MDLAVRTVVRERAQGRCEYCHLAESATPFIPFHVEHVVAQQHLVDDTLDNLALACDRCNAYKGPNLSTIDPATGEIVALYHPRQQEWDHHFLEEAGVIHGLTPTGRGTVHLLQMNLPGRVALREELSDDPSW